ncbi:MAG TPA: bifunctional phosphoglucose/phosphomannose isomerase [Candidatus Saccharimonadales bacterium]|nr:bifunctional phosphoglucose/phosphomannose isomerase [Candidatus Saccharimonadales bacterium]
MLDDANVLKQRDPSGALQVAATQYAQATFTVDVINPEHDNREINSVVVAGMGGSALAAMLVKSWLKATLSVPFEVVRSYDLPAYVGKNTLVIASSHSGNTEETVSGLEDAKKRGAQLAIITSGGKLQQAADANAIAHVLIPADLQPRMAVIYNLRALMLLLTHFGITARTRFDEIAAASEWLHSETRQWEAGVSVDKNYAKQLALLAVGKTPVVYGGTLMFPAAYKWKISWNENAKNVAFCNEIPEFNHNEFIGWSSHPVDKPFVVFDLVSNLENPRILKRFEISDRLLSGMRPKAHTVELAGDTAIKQLLWASILADFVSIYVAILNGVDPTPVALVEKLKTELA